jgi:F-type H+-transporting ATPase subunit alpha
MVILQAVNAGLLDEVALDKVEEIEAEIQQRVMSERPELCKRMEAGEVLDDTQWQAVLDVAKTVVDGGPR